VAVAAIAAARALGERPPPVSVLANRAQKWIRQILGMAMLILVCLGFSQPAGNIGTISPEPLSISVSRLKVESNNFNCTGFNILNSYV